MLHNLKMLPENFYEIMRLPFSQKYSANQILHLNLNDCSNCPFEQLFEVKFEQ